MMLQLDDFRTTGSFTKLLREEGIGSHITNGIIGREAVKILVNFGISESDMVKDVPYLPLEFYAGRYYLPMTATGIPPMSVDTINLVSTDLKKKIFQIEKRNFPV